MQTHVEFRPDRFPAHDGEEQQVNLGLWGKRLAEFLRDNFRNEGFRRRSDSGGLGWGIRVANEHFRLWIGCGHYQEYSDGFLCSIEPHTPFVRKLLKKIDTQAHFASLQRAMDKVLNEAAGIREKRWWTHVELNNPASQDRTNFQTATESLPRPRQYRSITWAGHSRRRSATRHRPMRRNGRGGNAARLAERPFRRYAECRGATRRAVPARGQAQFSFFRPSMPTVAQDYSLNFMQIPKGRWDMWPSGQVEIIVSSLNAPTGNLTAKAAIVPAGDAGGVNVFARNASELVNDY